ncbi:MAG: type 1 fimbrial protein [Rhodanobacter thiooxydans]|nr:type 1 fimbrial protein [Rhodanobacter thiooxydans]
MSIHPPRQRTPTLGVPRIGLLLLIALLAVMPGRGWAKCYFDPGYSQGTYSVAVPATIVNDPAVPVGSVLYTSYPTAISQPVSFTCGGNDRWGLVNNAGSTPATTDNLFPIGTTGVSYRVLQRGGYIYPYGYLRLGNSSWYESDAVTIELVKTGTIANGTTLQGPLASFKAGTPGNFIYDAVINLANSLTFTAPACQVSTSNITVALPTVTSQDFSGVGSVAGTAPFSIGLTCSSGATVRITLDTATPVAGKPGVIAPSSGSTGGVGVQVLDSSGVTPVSFGVAQTIGATPNGSLTVSYFARYYQTGSMVSAGLLGATATFTLSYQ